MCRLLEVFYNKKTQANIPISFVVNQLWYNNAVTYTFKQNAKLLKDIKLLYFFKS